MNSLKAVVFISFHLSWLLAFWSGASEQALAFAVGAYFTISFGVFAGYHRYFSHRAFKTSRAFQFLLALLGTLSLQKGVLHWAANHRVHHQLSDQPGDIHSPIVDGFYWAHIGWIISDKHNETKWDKVKDLSKFPELVWLNDNFTVVYLAWCAAVFFGLGFDYMVWGCLINTLVSWHLVFFVNSVLHVWGKQDCPTKDQSRNNAWLLIPLLGENWHNNHHYRPGSATLWFRWYQVDPTYLIICILESLGVVWGVNRHGK